MQTSQELIFFYVFLYAVSLYETNYDRNELSGFNSYFLGITAVNNKFIYLVIFFLLVLLMEKVQKLIHAAYIKLFLMFSAVFSSLYCTNRWFSVLLFISLIYIFQFCRFSFFFFFFFLVSAFNTFSSFLIKNFATHAIYSIWPLNSAKISLKLASIQHTTL